MANDLPRQRNTFFDIPRRVRGLDLRSGSEGGDTSTSGHSFLRSNSIIFLSSPCRCSAIGAMHTWAFQYRPNGPTGGASTGCFQPHAWVFQAMQRLPRHINFESSPDVFLFCVLDLRLSSNRIYIYIYIQKNKYAPAALIYTLYLSMLYPLLARRRPRCV